MTSETTRRRRTLYVAKRGQFFAGWWDTCPPVLEAGKRVPRFRAPDVWHDRAIGNERAVIATFIEARALERPDRIEFAPAEWAALGVSAGAASNRRRPPPPPNPEVGGLFAAAAVKPVPRDPEIEARRARLTVPRKPRRLVAS